MHPTEKYPTGFKVPRSRVHETHQILQDEIRSALEPLLFGPVGGEGRDIRLELERSFAKLAGRAYAISVHSGTIGLVIALRACGVGPGDEVITVANSDISTTGAISLCGAVPVLCDVIAADYTIDPSLVEPLITDRTKAILPVDLHGHPADTKALSGVAQRHGLAIVEDAALATGAEDHNRPIGAFADAAVFSFAPMKPLGSVGSGGIIVCDDPGIAERLELLTGYGHDPTPSEAPGSQNYLEEGYNVPLDPLQAALVRIKLPHLAGWTQRRREIAEAYKQGLTDTDAILPDFRSESNPTFRSYTIRVPNQKFTHDALRRVGVEAVLHYTPPVHHYTVYDAGLKGSQSLPITEKLSRELLSLPVTVELTDDDVRFAIDALRPLIGGNAQ